jgi:hypothetical protein
VLFDSFLSVQQQPLGLCFVSSVFRAEPVFWFYRVFCNRPVCFISPCFAAAAARPKAGRKAQRRCGILRTHLELEAVVNAVYEVKLSNGERRKRKGQLATGELKRACVCVMYVPFSFSPFFLDFGFWSKKQKYCCRYL